MIRERLGAVPLVVQLPIGAEAGFEGVVDLVGMRAHVWRDDRYEVADVPADLADEARRWRAALVETVAEHDDDVMGLYVEGVDPSPERLHAAIRRLTISSGSSGATVTP